MSGMLPRIRTVKPSFLVHGLLFDLGELTGFKSLLRLSYLGLWCFTDREARFEWKPRELKNGICPYDDVDFSLILNVLANAGFIVRYMHERRLYGWVPRFLDHQNINGREVASTLPPPPREAVSMYEDRLLKLGFGDFSMSELLGEPPTAASGVSPNNGNGLRESAKSADPSDTRGSRDTREGKGREGKGREGKRREEITATATSNADALDAQTTNDTSPPEASAAMDPLTTEHIEGADRTAANVAATGDIVASSPTSENGTQSSPSEQSGGITALVVVHDAARNVPALPAVRGARTPAAMLERFAVVLAEVATGQRTRMKREQHQKLNAEIVFAYWAEVFGHPRALFDAKREHRILARLSENGGDVSELLYALDGAVRDDKIMATGRCAGEQRYDGIETVLRDRGQVEKFAARRKRFNAGVRHAFLVQLEDAAAVTSTAQSQEAPDGERE